MAASGSSAATASARKRRLLRLLRLLRRLRAGFPLTLLGTAVAGLCVVAAIVYGARQLDLVMLALGGTGGVVLAAAFASVMLGYLVVRRALARARAPAPVHGECGLPVSTGFTLPRLRWLFCVDIDARWAEPQERTRLLGRGGVLHEEINPESRCHTDAVERRIEIRDRFGLVAIAFAHKSAQSVRIYPAVSGASQVPTRRFRAGGDELPHPSGLPEGDRVDLRPYAPGDPLTLLLWKSFAKSRELVVRTPERAISMARQTIAYLVTGPSDEAAASAARAAVEHRDLGTDWVLGADGCKESVGDVEEARDLLAHSASVRDSTDEYDLHRFLTTTAAGRLSRVLVFVPPVPGPWLERAARAAADRSSNLEFIICFDRLATGAAAAPRRFGWAFGPRPHAVSDDGRPSTSATGVQQLRQVVTALCRTGAPTHVLERASGRTLFAQQFLRMQA